MEIIFLDDGTLRLDLFLLHGFNVVISVNVLCNYAFPCVKALRDAVDQQIE